MSAPSEKLAALRRSLAQAGPALVAFSGGADSTLLLCAARDALGGAVTAATVRSAAMAESELDDARRFCRERGIPLELNLLGLRDHRRYPRDLFWEVAAEEGNAVVLGSDAHTPGDVYSDQDLADAYALLDRCGLPGDRVLTELEDRF